MPENARKQHVVGTGGPWGTGLLLLGCAVTVQGVSFAVSQPDDYKGALLWINGAVSVASLGVLWIVAGLYSIVRALTPPQRHTEVAPAVGVICLWAMLHLVFWLYQGFWGCHWSRDWTAAVAWSSLAALLISWSRCVNPPSRRR